MKNQLTVEGDSMVDALNPRGDRNTLPAMLAKKLGGRWNVTDVSWPGDAVSEFVRDDYVTNASYNVNNPRNELIVWGGVNDGGREGDTAAFAASEMQAYLTAELAVGWRITLIAVLPVTPYPVDWVFRVDFNAAMKAWCAAHNVRWLDPTQNGQLLDYNDKIYYKDGIHLTAAGEKIVADQVYALLTA